jgi:hypothetical protein
MCLSGRTGLIGFRRNPPPGDIVLEEMPRDSHHVVGADFDAVEK